MGNDPAPPAQLQSLRVLLELVAYSKCDFRVMGVSRAFIKSETVAMGIFVVAPLYAGEGLKTRWGLSKPL